MILPSVSGLGTIPTLGPVNCIIKATATTNNAAIGPVGAATCKRKISVVTAITANNTAKGMVGTAVTGPGVLSLFDLYDSLYLLFSNIQVGGCS